MSELLYGMKCPRCKQNTDVLFSGSGTKGICLNCGYELPPEKSYRDYQGSVINYV